MRGQGECFAYLETLGTPNWSKKCFKIKKAVKRPPLLISKIKLMDL